jgi:predicted transcriptional regulator
LPNLIREVHTALEKVAREPGEQPAEPLRPAVPIRKSVMPDYIVCLEDGKKFKSLKRHLRTHYDLSPEQYREKWGLPHDYPMVAPSYARARSDLAKKMGLGQKGRQSRAS